MVIHTTETTLVQKLLQVKLQEIPPGGKIVQQCADCSMHIVGNGKIWSLLVGNQWLVVGRWLVCSSADLAVLGPGEGHGQ